MKKWIGESKDSLSILKKIKDLLDILKKMVSNIIKTVKEGIDFVEGVSPKYNEVRDAETLERIEFIERPAIIALAAIIGKTRLIYNIIIGR